MPKKSSTERVRAYRQRQLALRPPKNPPKSGSQRAREYRARKKALKMAAASGIQVPTAADNTELIAVNDAKMKWKSLRQQFKEKLEKLPASTSNTLPSKETEQKPYIQPLLFMRNSESKETNEKQNATEVINEIEESKSSADIVASVIQTKPISKVLLTEAALEQAIKAYNRKRLATTVPRIMNPLQNEEKKSRTHLIQETKSLDKIDEDLAFFCSLLPHVRRMSPLSKLAFRIDIKKLLMERAYGVNYISAPPNDAARLPNVDVPPLVPIQIFLNPEVSTPSPEINIKEEFIE